MSPHQPAETAQLRQERDRGIRTGGDTTDGRGQGRRGHPGREGTGETGGTLDGRGRRRRGHPGREGTPWTGGAPRREGTEREQHRLQ